MNDVVKEAVRLVKLGEKDEARRLLIELVRDQPQEAQAWAVLADLIDEPNHKRQILKRLLKVEGLEPGLSAWGEAQLEKLDVRHPVTDDNPTPQVGVDETAQTNAPLSGDSDRTPHIGMSTMVSGEDTTPHNPIRTDGPDTEPDVPFDDEEETVARDPVTGAPKLPSSDSDRFYVESDMDDTQVLSKTQPLDRDRIQKAVREKQAETEAETSTVEAVSDFAADEPDDNRTIITVLVVILALLVIAAIIIGVIVFSQRESEQAAGLPFVPTLTLTATLAPTLTLSPTLTTVPTETATPTATPLPTGTPTITPRPTLEVVIPTEGVQVITPPQGASSFGAQVALSGQTLVISALQAGAPAALIYERQGEEWVEQQALDFDGRAVAISGDTLAASDGQDTVVYTLEEAGWQPVARLNPSVLAETPELDFGADLALSGDVLVIGAVQPFGAVAIFERVEDEWTEAAVLTRSDADGFGRTVATNGSAIVIGAQELGEALVYSRDEEGAWVEAARYSVPDSERFGARVAISEGVIAVAAPGAAPGDSGAVYLYDDVRGRGEWAEIEPVVLDAPNTPDPFGFAEHIALAQRSLVTSGPNALSTILFYEERSNRWRLVQALAGPVESPAVIGLGSVATDGQIIVAGSPDGVNPTAVVIFELD